jgi:hypothetical protein
LKYIEFSDDEIVVFGASEAHSDVAHRVCANQPEEGPLSAGFVTFTDDLEGPITYGRSTSLRLDGRDIKHLRQRTFFGGRREDDGWLVVSTCLEKARCLLRAEPKPCVWSLLEMPETRVEFPLPSGERHPSFFELGH